MVCGEDGVWWGWCVVGWCVDGVWWGWCVVRMVCGGDGVW